MLLFALMLDLRRTCLLKNGYYQPPARLETACLSQAESHRISSTWGSTGIDDFCMQTFENTYTMEQKKFVKLVLNQ